MLSSIELFTGAGGLARGLHCASFRHLLLVEKDPKAYNSLVANKKLLGLEDRPESIKNADVSTVDYGAITVPVDLLAAGVSCQPFSQGGLHLGYQDERDLFHQVFRAQREIQPKVVLIENVKGLERNSFSEYLRYIELQLAFPDLTPKEYQGKRRWRDLLSALQQLERKDSSASRKQYVVSRCLLNAADYGVAQLRYRVFLVAIRTDLGVTWVPPGPTHSRDALLDELWGSGQYWRRHGIDAPTTPKALSATVDGLVKTRGIEPWRTVRDALHGLPRPTLREVEGYLHHYHRPGARSYHGHSGSTWDYPSKTLKAGVHGVPGGENMLRNRNGSVRYFTIREAARLQSFPDSWRFDGAWTRAMKQIGNAVPVDLATAVATSIRTLIEGLGVDRPKTAKAA